MQHINLKGLVRKATAAVTAAVMLMGTSAVELPVLGATSAMGTCQISTGTKYQTITGFGGINHPEWAGDLTAAQRQTAFGNGDNELGLTVLRVFVNPDSSQWNRALATAQFAQKMGATVFASPWEAPSNLKQSGNGSAQGGKVHLPSNNYEAYAKHLNDFGTYMKNNGVDLYSISVQNEPDYAHDWMGWTSDETTNFVKNYGHLITSTRLMSPETFQYTNKDYYNKILNDKQAFDNIDVFATHFYGTQRSQMDFPALENCGKPIWMTEVYVPNSTANSNNNWDQAIQVSENIHNGLVVGNMSAYVWWYIRRSYSPMSEDGSISKRGYAMAQFSKYVRPGAVRIGCTEQPNSNVLVSAYENTNGSIAIVAINKGSGQVTQDFATGANIQGVASYRTSSNENISKGTVSYNGGNFSANLPAKSVTTFVVTTDKTSGGNPNGGVTPPPTLEEDKDGYYIHDTFENGTDDWSGRGGATVSQSSNAYAGEKALLVSDRTSGWRGAEKSLNAAYKAGDTFSISICAANVSADQNLMLSIQYTDASGETQYDHIASATTSAGNYVLLTNPSYTLPKGSGYTIYVETDTGMTGDILIDEFIVAPEGTVISGPSAVKFMRGDLNADGVINAADLSLAKLGLMKGFAD